MKRNQMAVLTAAAALAIAASVIVGLTITSTGSPDKQRTRASRAAATRSPEQTSTPTTTAATGQIDESKDRLAPPGEPDARLVVQRFLRAFASYEVADINPQVRREATATSTPALSASLLGRPPRPVNGSRPAAGANIANLTLTGTGAGGSIEYLADLDRGGIQESFSLTVTPTVGKWRVERLNGA